MINISEPGPLMRKYGEMNDVSPADVLAWVHDYCNGPWPDSLIPHLEATEKERLQSIKGYIERQVSSVEVIV